MEAAFGGPRRGALSGIRVVEFGQYVAGPLLGMLLADQGAAVIKVERPQGDPARSSDAFRIWNRGKRSVVLDLKTERGRADAHQLIAEADVVIENYRPGVADRLSIGYATASALNPRLVYCSLPGYGKESPRRFDAGWDPVIGAELGLHQRGEASIRRDDDELPLYLDLPLPSMLAGILGSIAASAALVAREHSGLGQLIEIPLQHAMFAIMGRQLLRGIEKFGEDPREVPRLPIFEVYKGGDGRYLQSSGHYERFVDVNLTAAGHPEWVADATAILRRAPSWDVAAMWRERFATMYSERSAQEWEDIINRAGGACTLCRSLDEWVENDHARAAGIVVEVEDAEVGRMVQPGASVNLRGTPGPSFAPAPTLGSDTQAVLTALRTRRTVASTPAPAPGTSGALSGIRVLDLCIILAGPTCGRVLAEFGADVIKIDDPQRWLSVHGALDVGRGKRSILLDLRTDAGKDVFWRLVDTADVIVENYRPGKLEKLGFGYDEVSKRRPNIIYVSLNAYGFRGPWEQRPGWEQNAEATTGMLLRHTTSGGRPLSLSYPANDYGTGLLGAYGAMLALFERSRSGRGQRVDTGLVPTACLLQSAIFCGPNTRRRPIGDDPLGTSALSRLHPTSDGWLFLHVPDERSWSALTALPAFGALATDRRFMTAAERLEHDAELTGCISAVLSSDSTEAWLRALHEKGVAAGAKRSLRDIEADDTVRNAGLLLTRWHPGIGHVQHTGPVASLSGTPMQLGSPMPVFGADTSVILEELGYSATEIQEMLAARTAVQGTAVQA